MRKRAISEINTLKGRNSGAEHICYQRLALSPQKYLTVTAMNGTTASSFVKLYFFVLASIGKCEM